MSHSVTRKPEKPFWFYRAGPGRCRVCGGGVFHPDGRPAQSSWHRHCLHRWLIASNQSYARRFVFMRDRGVCAKCGEYHGPPEADVDDLIRRLKAGEKVELGRWELDHCTPLHRASRQWWAFNLPNMQTLCKRCHRIKTKEEHRLLMLERSTSEPPQLLHPQGQLGAATGNAGPPD